MPSEAFFLDSAYPIALVSSADQHHAAAATASAELKVSLARLVTTRAVLLEIGNALARPHLRSFGIELLAGLESDPRIEIVPLDESLCRRGFDLFRSRPDKGWSWTDCISFVVMRERGLTEALTSDQHFEQAGFSAVLRR